MSTLFTPSATLDSTFYPRMHRLAGKRPRPDMNPPSHDVLNFSTVHFKRPRKVITPVSAAISVVTPENDASIPLSIPPPPPHAHPLALPAPHLAHHPLYHTQHQQTHSIYSHALSHHHRPQPQQHQQQQQFPVYQAYATTQPYYQLHPPHHQNPLPHPSSLFQPTVHSVAPDAATVSASTGALYIPHTATTYSTSTARGVTVAPPSPGASLTPPPQSFLTASVVTPLAQGEAKLQADVSNSFATGHTGAIAWTNELLVQVLASEMDELCAHNKAVAPMAMATIFHDFFSPNRQPFELDFYMARLVQYANCSTAAFVLMLVYIDRVQQRCTDLLLTDMNCHRIILTALVLAIKYLDDEVFSNAHYSRVGGVTPREMNELELKMLELLRWDLSVAPETYAMYEDGLVQSARHLLPNALLTSSPASPI